MNHTRFVTQAVLIVLLAGLGSACQQPSATRTSAAVPVASPLSAVSATGAALPAQPQNSQAPEQSQEDAMPRINVQDAKVAFEKGEAVIVDVRGPDAYKSNHIKGALDHSLSKLEQGDFNGLPKDKRIIAYCSCPTEHSSARAAFVLQKAGFKDVAALVGGNMAWEAAGYAMVKAAPVPAGPNSTPVVGASPVNPKAQKQTVPSAAKTKPV